MISLGFTQYDKEIEIEKELKTNIDNYKKTSQEEQVINIIEGIPSEAKDVVLLGYIKIGEKETAVYAYKR